ncbi:NosD domain-containing protein, partial [Candidatus Omnitrophota bacterium]
TGVYVTGSTDGDLTVQPNQGESDAYLRKYNHDGTDFETWQFGTGETDYASDVAVNALGVYVVGSTEGSLAGSNEGRRDAFIRKYDFDGNEIWTKQFGTIKDDSATAVAVEATGVYVVGHTLGSFSGLPNSTFDAFIRKYDHDGNEEWTRQFGSTGGVVRTDCAVDETGVYIVGDTNGTFEGETKIGTKGEDAFIRKYDHDGNEEWTVQFGSPVRDVTNKIAVDETGVYVAGIQSSNYPPDPSDPVPEGVSVWKFDHDGNEEWTRQFGSPENENSVSIAVNQTGVYVAGSTLGAFPDYTNSGGRDIFVRKYNTFGFEIWTKQFGSTGSDWPSGLAAVPSALYMAGYTNGNLLGQSNHGGNDAFVLKFAESFTVTESITLTGDMGPVSGNGIIIGADFITIDGNGHTISGDGSGSGIILNGKNNVTIKNCNITGFQRGILVDGGFTHLIAKNSLANNSIAIDISSGTHHAIYYNIILDNETGVHVGSSGNQISHNTLWNNEVQIQDAGGNSWHDPLIGYGNLWSNYWGEDTDGDFIGDTDLPHEGVDNAPLLDPSIPDQYYPIYAVLPKAAATNNDSVGKRAWLQVTRLVWRGGWSPVELQVTDPLGRILSATENQIGLLAFYTEDETVVPDSKLAMIIIGTDTNSPLGDYSLNMTALDDLTYSTQWFASNANGILFHQSVENVPLVSGETQNITMTKTSDGVFPIKSLVTIISELIDYIENEGLHGGLENSLTSKLENVISKLEKGNEQAAVNQLGAFVNEVEAKRGKKKGLSDEQADELISVAETLIDNIDGSGESAKRFASPEKTEIPEKFKLSHNSPNPFNPVTTIGYDIPDGVTGTVSLKVYDMRGALIRTLVDGVRSPGHYSSTWNGRDENGRRVSSGVYLYRLQADGFKETKKMILLR